jgi:hypothetical protein
MRAACSIILSLGRACNGRCLLSCRNVTAPVCHLLLQFLSRPFVAGDSITVQSTRHVIVSGTVERITPLRTLMRTDDDVLVTVPNKV